LMFDRARIRPARGGGVRLRLPPDERALLRSLPAQLSSLLDEAPDDPSLERLFPPAYDDAEDEAEYQHLMGEELLDGRRRALHVLEETVDEERLTAEQAESWLKALNDLRLVLGTRLGVRDDTLLEGLRSDDPNAVELALYAYLSWLQEQLVEALDAQSRF
jgi:Domain of unknown function (DUF2017)